MIAYWKRLRPVFTDASEFDDNPAIEISHICADSMREILYWLLQNSADLDTELHYVHRYTEAFIGSVDEVIQQFMAGEIAGALWVSLDVDGYVLPRLGFFIDEPGYITVDYQMGEQWTPIAIIALFELFRQMFALDDLIEISLSPYYFWKKRRIVFDETLQEYMNETLE